MGKAGSASRQTTLKPLGMFTTPNAYGVFPPGALSDATNCILRRPGVLEAAPGATNVATVGASVLERIRVVAPLDAGHVFSLTFDDSFWRLYENVLGSASNSGALALASSAADSFTESRATVTRSRDRVLFNSNYGVMVGDYMQPSSLAQRTLRWAGMIQPGISVAGSTTGAQGAIPNNVMVAYTAVVSREYSDGYIIKSVPAVGFKFLNNSGSNLSLSLNVLFSSARCVAGDIVEVYRTNGLSTTVWTADPGPTFKLVWRHVLTAGEAAAGGVTFSDEQAMLASFYQTDGRELYTNPYQEGALQANRQPDVCKAMATFKGFTFYANLTERARWEFSVPAGVNDTTVMAAGNPRRASGLGLRAVAGTITNGSATVTAVNAANLVGVKVGQIALSVVGPFPYGTTVTAVGASTITMSAAATAGAATYTLADQVEISGVAWPVIAYQSFAIIGYETTVNKTLSYDQSGDSPGTNFVLENPQPAGATAGQKNITLRGTNGANYSPPIPEFTATVQTISPINTPNLLRWSKDSEPEHVPGANETLIGSGQVLAMCTTKDALWIACSDGIYRLSGDGGVWRNDLVAPGCVLVSPKTIVNVREVPHAVTNYGLVAVTDAGIVPLSYSKFKERYQPVTFAENPDRFMGINPTDNEALYNEVAFSYMHVYNATSDAYTRVFTAAGSFRYFTAFAWQDAPASGNQTVIIANHVPGSLPTLFAWNSTASFLDMLAVFYPFYDKDPFTNKQWIDVTYLFLREANAYQLTANLAGSAIASNLPIGNVQGGSEAETIVGVPRSFAIAPKITPGFTVSNINTANRVMLYGVSLRYVALTLQAGARQ